jgi:hypothetical protein
MSIEPWQRASILAAANYLKATGVTGDARAQALCQGLLEVLEPSRRTIRLQKESAESAKAAAVAGHDRRAADRRRVPDRRKRNVGRPGGERRSGHDRRSGRDRRHRE